MVCMYRARLVAAHLKEETKDKIIGLFSISF